MLWAIVFHQSLMTHEGTFFLFQRLSVTIQRFNAVCFANSFRNIDVGVQCIVSRDSS